MVDKPIIQYAFEEARAAGIEHFIFVTGRGKNVIEDHFDRAYELDDALLKKDKMAELDSVASWLPTPGELSYTRQQEPLGLGHAVWCARHLVGNQPFAVILVDDLIMSKVPCLKQMVEAHAETGGNIVAVEEVPARAHQPLRRARPGRRRRPAGRRQGPGREARSGQGALAPCGDRPLHPAAGGVRAPRSPSDRRRRRDPADRCHGPDDRSTSFPRSALCRATLRLRLDERAISKRSSPARRRAMTCAPTCVPSSSVIGSRTGDASAAVRTEKSSMRIAMIGTGYVGLVSAACFAEFGVEVVAVDNNQSKIDCLLKGSIPIYEPGLDDMVARHAAAGRLTFTTDMKQAVAERRCGVHRGRHAVPARRRPCRPHLSVRRRRGDRAQPDRRCGRGHQVDRAGRHRPPPAAAVRQAPSRPRDRGRLEPRVPARGLGDRGLLAAGPHRGRGRDRRRPPGARSPVSAAEPYRRRRSCSPRSRPPS